MTEDARYEDARYEDAGSAATGPRGPDRPLNIWAEDAEGLTVLSALAQDAIFPIGDMVWLRSERRFAILLNRFRWEDRKAAEQSRRGFERVRSVLSVGDVQSVTSQGIDRADRSLILSLLSVAFAPGPDGTGRVTLTLAGDGAIAMAVECLDVRLKDVTRPYLSPARKVPSHPE